MRINTEKFGTIDISDDKIITFDNGIIGFQDYKKYTLIYDADSEEKSDSAIMWLQSMEEAAFALPVLKPEYVKPDYNPIADDEMLKCLGSDNIDNAHLLIFVTITVPHDITKMTCNLKAPIIINADTLKAVQLIAENEDYLVRYPIYDYLKEQSGKDGE